MRISDWSSDVCSSDLSIDFDAGETVGGFGSFDRWRAFLKQSAERSRLSRRAFIQAGGAGLAVSTLGAAASTPAVAAVGRQWSQTADLVVVGSGAEIGRAAWRERVGHTGKI